MTQKANDARVLPNNLQVVFRSIVRQYEQKQYKKALKAADQVLKKVPSHGETLAMRGLTLNAMERKEEAYDHVKRGLRNDLRSHVCWHVYGLLYRSDRDYGEAVKCYLNALKWDRDNLQILRDLSLLQVQLQEYEGFIETRRRILQLKSNNKNNWIAYAVGNLLGGRHGTAQTVVTRYLATEAEPTAAAKAAGANAETLAALTNGQAPPTYEESELVLFRNQALAESGDLEAALEDLDTIRGKVLDLRAFLSQRGRYLLQLGRYTDALEVFRELLDLNADNYDYHRGFQTALLELSGELLAHVLDEMRHTALPSNAFLLDAGQSPTLEAAYAELAERFPRSPAVRRIPLSFLASAERDHRIRSYVLAGLRKGRPNLGADLRSLIYMDHPTKTGFRCVARVPEDVAATELFVKLLRMTDELLTGLRGDAMPDWVGGDGDETPAVELWVMFLKVQLLEAAGRLEEAFALCEECIGHTPTAIDLYMRKGRLLKKMGDIQGAAEIMDFARKIDLADRYINNKATKYLLRAGRVPDAEGTIALFTRHEGGDAQDNLYRMQCSWYELEWAEAEQRARRYGPALKKFYAVDKHFEDFYEDQFDFHTYCIRKGTLRAYVDLLRMASTVQAQPSFHRAAKGIIRTFLALHDDPASLVAVEAPAPPASAASNGGSQASKAPKPAPTQTAAPRQKAKKKTKKASKKAKKGGAEETKGTEVAKEDEATANGGGDGASHTNAPASLDADPVGEKLLERDGLAEASKFSAILNRRCPNEMDTHVLAYDVAIRRGKRLQAFRALVRGFETVTGYDHPDLFARIVDFELREKDGGEGGDEVAGEVVTEMAERWRQGTDVNGVVDRFRYWAQSAEGTLRMRVEAAKAMVATGMGTADEAEALVVGGIGGRGATVVEWRYALEVMASLGQDAGLRERLVGAFPRAGF